MLLFLVGLLWFLLYLGNYINIFSVPILSIRKKPSPGRITRYFYIFFLRYIILKYPSMPWYLMLPVNISRNCDLMLAAIVTSIDALPLYYVTLDNRRKDA